MTTPVITQTPTLLEALGAALTELRRGHVRLAVARLIDRNPRVCWMDLVAWSIGAIPRDEVRCLGECARLTDADPGGCYCGKHMRADVYAALKEERDA